LLLASLQCRVNIDASLSAFESVLLHTSFEESVKALALQFLESVDLVEVFH
jgi:hypothetical protein